MSPRSTPGNWSASTSMGFCSFSSSATPFWAADASSLTAPSTDPEAFCPSCQGSYSSPSLAILSLRTSPIPLSTCMLFTHSVTSWLQPLQGQTLMTFFTLRLLPEDLATSVPEPLNSPSRQIRQKWWPHGRVTGSLRMWVFLPFLWQQTYCLRNCSRSLSSADFLSPWVCPVFGGSQVQPQHFLSGSQSHAGFVSVLLRSK
mmetsp:Transcript_10464/g.32039  ORF Transcript_10464/g.32039 Transcript_10464/m.32039 type:complete len:201 (-) Transcript_10464:1253-1855(-)